MSTGPSSAAALTRPGSKTELFWAFNRLALQGFGGVLAVAQRELVERLRWLSREDFVELLATAQVLPGPNVVNLALMIGDRFFGLRGAFAALAGMLLIPSVLVLALAMLAASQMHRPEVRGALRGMGAVAAGLVLATGVKLLPALRGTVLGTLPALLLGASAIVAIALLRLPLPWVVLVLGGLGSGLAAWRLWRRRA